MSAVANASTQRAAGDFGGRLGSLDMEKWNFLSGESKYFFGEA